VTRALSGDPETYQTEPFAHRMGMLPWRGTVFFTHGYPAHMGVFIDMGISVLSSRKYLFPPADPDALALLIVRFDWV
jgi:hypothetical protein